MMIQRRFHKAITIFFLCAIPAMVAACAPTRKQSPAPAPDLSPIQRQLAETDEKVNQLYQRVSMIQLMVDNHQRDLQELENRLTESNDQTTDALPPDMTTATASQAAGEPEPTVTSPTKTSPDPEKQEIVKDSVALYRKALKSFRTHNFQQAESLFEEFVNRYEDDPLADNALYWLGECHYAQRDFADAILRFKEVINRFPQGGKVPDALLKIGFSYFSMGDKEQAKSFLKKVVTNYPFTTAGEKAEEKLKELQPN